MSKAPDNDWGVLMAAAQAGSESAYRRLLREVQAWLIRFYGRRLPPGEIDDAVQETLIAIHQKRHTYDPQRPFKPWLTAVARYKWIDRLRAMGRGAVELLPEDMVVPDHETAIISASILKRLMATLKPAQRDAIRLVKLEGYSVEDASAKTGQSASLIKINVHRGLAKIATIVQGQVDVD